MSFNKKELEELKPFVSEAVKKRLGYSESSVVSAALSCVSRNLDKRSSCEILSSLLDDVAPQFVDDLFEKVEIYKANKAASSTKHLQHKKRSLQDVFGDDAEESSTVVQKKVKKSRFEALKDDHIPLPPAVPDAADGPAPLNNQQVTLMLDNMKKQIEERKRQLDALKRSQGIAGMPAPMMHAPVRAHTVQPTMQQQVLMNEAIDKAKRAAELQSKIQAQLANKPSLLSGLTSASASLLKSGLVTLSAVTDKNILEKANTGLILDKEGRTIDTSTGKILQLSSMRLPTLKANIRAKKMEQFKLEKPSDEISNSQYFDDRLSPVAGARTKKTFKFHEQGRFQQIAHRIRAKAQLERLQAAIAQTAKRTGISSATKLALIAPSDSYLSEVVPDIEWWDAVILPQGYYDDLSVITEKSGSDRLQGITKLVEHPVQKHPPAEPKEAAEIPIMLTKKERKKIRTQRRREAEKESQEKIRLGLMPPPPPKVKISNLMRVLANEAIQDPTKVEAHVRAQMAQRQRAHEAANAARKLTPEAKKQKLVSKLKEDTTLGVHVGLFRVRDLSNPQKKYKVDINAQQYYMTGCALMSKEYNIVVVEGGPKALKKYKRLMLNRIKWREDKKGNIEEDSDDEHKTTPRVDCVLVWEGTIPKRNFSDFKMKFFTSQVLAREHLKKYGVEHYWDLALSESILAETDD